MTAQTFVLLRAGGWHPGSVVGASRSPQQWVDRLIDEAGTLHSGTHAPDFVGIDSAAHAHDADGEWRLVAVDALTTARRLTSRTDLRFTVVPTVTVADLDPATALDILERDGQRLDLQVRVTNRYVGAGPMVAPTPPFLDLTDPEVLRGMDARFTKAADDLLDVRAVWAKQPDRRHPAIWALAHLTIPYRLAVRVGDYVALTPLDAEHAQSILREVRALEAERARPLRKFADVTVCVADTADAAADRMADLDLRAGRPLRSDAAVFVGAVDDLLAQCREWCTEGFDGVRFRPCGNADVETLAEAVLPRLSADR
ncbi:LLM class flavin-dependent oxidoreductase [Nocardia callitridis]|uniref:Luciferase-like domain-containing protein n=1 Tax=Nocardia callitridis TaxID=648753 RepID=A0ABP9KW51_9NOCA